MAKNHLLFQSSPCQMFVQILATTLHFAQYTRGTFRTQSNFCDGPFLRKFLAVNYFLKVSILGVRLGSKSAPCIPLCRKNTNDAIFLVNMYVNKRLCCKWCCYVVSKILLLALIHSMIQKIVNKKSFCLSTALVQNSSKQGDEKCQKVYLYPRAFY